MDRLPRRFLPLLAALALTALAPGQGTGLAVRAYYTGTIGVLPIQMDLLVDGEGVSGSYYYERVGEPLFLSGTMLAYDEMALDEEDAQGARTGSLRAMRSYSYTEVGGTLAGTWSSPDGLRTLPLSLSKAADYVTVQTRQGERLEVTSLYPFFLEPQWQAVNGELQERALSEHHAFVQEGQEIELGGELWHGWWMHEARELSYYAADLVSLLVITSTYTGGAHPNTHYAAATYGLEGEGARLLDLRDLFLPGSAFLERLSAYVLAALRAQEALWVVNGDIGGFGEEGLRVFTLSPEGLSFAFAPYEVGPYAQGPHFVTVPYGDLRDLIDPVGPLGRF